RAHAPAARASSPPGDYARRDADCDRVGERRSLGFPRLQPFVGLGCFRLQERAMSTERCISPSLDAGPSLQLLDGGRTGSMTDSIEQDLAQDVDLDFERMVREHHDRLY